MFGLLQLLGRSRALRALDRALREAGLRPRSISEAVKLTVVQIVKQHKHAGLADPEIAVDDAVRLLAYCILGRDQFIASNSTDAADQAEHRLEAAIAAGEGGGRRDTAPRFPFGRARSGDSRSVRRRGRLNIECAGADRTAMLPA